jgi:hypothetical protein
MEPGRELAIDIYGVGKNLGLNKERLHGMKQFILSLFRIFHGRAREPFEGEGLAQYQLV